MRLVVNHSSGLSADLWSWSLEVTQVSAARVEVVCKTSSFLPEAKHEHHIRARALPVWCSATLQCAAAIDFSSLPPHAQWRVYLDDAPTLALRLEQDGKTREFECFYAPKLWPPLPDATRAAVQRIFELLDPVARHVHIPLE